MLTAQQIVKHLIENDELDVQSYFDDMVNGWKLIDTISKKEWTDLFKVQGYQVVVFKKMNRDVSARDGYVVLMIKISDGGSVDRYKDQDGLRELEEEDMREFVDDFLVKRIESRKYACFVDWKSPISTIHIHELRN